MTETIKWINYASEGTTAVIVRVPNFEHTFIAWALDAGASGVIIPHVRCDVWILADAPDRDGRASQGDRRRCSLPDARECDLLKTMEGRTHE